MNDMNNEPNQQISSPTFIKKLALFFTLICAVYFLYAPGIDGAFYYDDFRPFTNLAQVIDIQSALIFITTETSGPLGRPLSMLSFLFEHAFWSGNTKAVFTVNILIHLINGLLVFSLTYLTLLLVNKSTVNALLIDRTKVFYISISAATLWLILPIHSATVFIAIQRMTEMSAMFVLCGINLYLYGLIKQSQSNVKNTGLILQLMGLCVFSVLAMLGKENGVLLPVFILVLEVTLLVNVSVINQRRQLRQLAGFGTLISILLFLAYTTAVTGNELPGRHYTVLERLVIQPQILIEYLQISFLPQIAQINPFHDSYLFHKIAINHQTIISVLLIISLFIFSILMRKKHPIISFAILWFFTAHLLESTSLGLELHFLHRNYIALIGFCIAIAYWVYKNNSKYNKVIKVFFGCYLAMLAFSQLQTSSLWGEPHRAAIVWNDEQKTSPRATENLAIHLFNKGDLDNAALITFKQAKKCQNCAAIIAQSLFYACLQGDKEKTNFYLSKLYAQAKSAKDTRAIPQILRKLNLAVNNKHCLLKKDEINRLNIAYLSMSNSPFNKKLGFLQNLYIIALEKADVVNAINWLELAWQEQKDFAIASELVSMYKANNRFFEASQLVEIYCQQTTMNLALKNKKMHQCEILKEKTNKKGQH